MFSVEDAIVHLAVSDPSETLTKLNCNFIAVRGHKTSALLCCKEILHSLTHYLETAKSFTNTHLKISLASFIISIAPRDAFGSLGFTAFSTKRYSGCGSCYNQSFFNRFFNVSSPINFTNLCIGFYYHYI